MNHPDGARVLSSAKPADSLLHALLWVCSRFGVNKSPSSFLAGLPSTERLSLDQGLRALENSGFRAGLAKKPLKTIPAELLPCVLVLKDGTHAVLVEVPEISAFSKFALVTPDAAGDAHVEKIEEAELERSYSGYCILIKQLPKLAISSEDEEQEKQSEGSRWLWGTVWRYRRYYLDSVLASIIVNILSTFIGLFAIHVYDRVIPHKAYSTLWALVVGVSVAILFEAIARQVRDYLLDLAARKSDIILSTKLFTQALGLRLEYTPPSSGAFAHKVRQFETVRDFGTSATLTVITDLPFTILFIFLIYGIAGQMAIVPLICMAVVIAAAAIAQYPLHLLMSKQFRDQAAMMGVLIESIEGIETLRVTGASGIMIKKYEELTAASALSGMKYRLLSNITMTFFNLVQQSQTVIMIIWGTYLIHENQLSTGALVGCMIFAGRAFAPVGAFVNLSTRFQTAKTALKGLNDLMNMPVERDPSRSYLPKTSVTGDIEVSKLTFAYPATGNHKAPLALRDVNLKIASGEKLAFVGKIGSGKSTLLRMIAGIYQPIEGQVKIDGLDIRQIDPVDFRNNIGYVTQDLRLFRGTLRENIFLGRPSATVEAFEEVVKLTGLDKIADSHPMGYDMPIGSMGLGLSGGQRQLVALARALITRPKILLMDEPTSAMDMQTEAMFTKRLEEIVDGRTVIIVTHRPSLLHVVDRIVVMDQQRLAADGPKKDILELLSRTSSTAVSKGGVLSGDEH